MHDCKGSPITVGALVLLAARVLSTSPESDACNFTAEVLGEGKGYNPQLTGNTRLTLVAVVPPQLTDTPVLDLTLSTGSALLREIRDNAPRQEAIEEEVPLDIQQSKAWRRQIDDIQTKYADLGGFPRGDVINLASEIELDPVRPGSHPRHICVDRLRHAAHASTRTACIIALTEAGMWLGQDLKLINQERPGSQPDPYPESRNPASARIEPTADALKFAGLDTRAQMAIVSLPPHQQRVVMERHELNLLIGKLAGFIDESPVFIGLPAEEQSRLVAQLVAMRAYDTVLVQRIDAFQPPEISGLAKHEPQSAEELAEECREDALSDVIGPGTPPIDLLPPSHREAEEIEAGENLAASLASTEDASVDPDRHPRA